jgi:hypothetical protein
MADMSTLAVVEEILRETARPMSVREIVEGLGAKLPSKSKTPETVVARDLSMHIKKQGETSLFVRTSPGRFTLRALATGPTPVVGAAEPTSIPSAREAEIPMVALPARMPTISAPRTSAVSTPEREAEHTACAR